MIRFYIYILLCSYYEKVITAVDFEKYTNLITLLIPEQNLVNLLETTVIPEVIAHKSDSELLAAMNDIFNTISVDSNVISLIIKEGTKDSDWLPLYEAVLDNIGNLETTRNKLLSEFVCTVDTDQDVLPF